MGFVWLLLSKRHKCLAFPLLRASSQGSLSVRAKSSWSRTFSKRTRRCQAGWCHAAWRISIVFSYSLWQVETNTPALASLPGGMGHSLFYYFLHLLSSQLEVIISFCLFWTVINRKYLNVDSHSSGIGRPVLKCMEKYVTFWFINPLPRVSRELGWCWGLSIANIDVQLLPVLSKRGDVRRYEAVQTRLITSWRKASSYKRTSDCFEFRTHNVFHILCFCFKFMWKLHFITFASVLVSLFEPKWLCVLIFEWVEVTRDPVCESQTKVS